MAAKNVREIFDEEQEARQDFMEGPYSSEKRERLIEKGEASQNAFWNPDGATSDDEE